MKGRIRIFALGIIASLLFCLVPMFGSEYSAMRFSGIYVSKDRTTAQNDTNSFKYISGVKIEQTIEMKVNDTTILDPWAVFLLNILATVAVLLMCIWNQTQMKYL